MSELVKACPECDDSHIQIRVGGYAEPGNSGYSCNNCGAEFEEPKEREPKRHSPLTGLAKKLYEHD
jgi:transposase-like protein